MPGSVFVSRIQKSPFSSRRKSVREYPWHPIALCACSAQERIFAAISFGVAPAAMGYACGLDSHLDCAALIYFGTLVLSGLRLRTLLRR